MIAPPPKRLKQFRKELLKAELNKDIYKLLSVLIKDKEGTDDKKIYWDKFNTKATKTENEISTITKELFREQEEDVLRRIDNEKSIKGRESQFLQTLADMNRIWLSKFLPFVKELIIKIGGEKLEEVNILSNIDLTTPAMQKFLNVNVAKTVKGINKTTKDALTKEIIEGFALGEGIPKIKDRVRKVFKFADKVRATKIARTESIRISNFSANQAFLQSGVVSAKEWLTTKDGRQDFACDELDGKIVSIAKDFLKEGDSLGSGPDVFLIEENIGYPPLHVNCRCTLLPVLL